MLQTTIEYFLPKTLGPIHIIGIGGIGMSGIAEILHQLGYQVQGSEMQVNANSARLESLGIRIMTGHKAENIQEAAIVVKSTAVKETNAEIIAAKKAGIPIIRRAEMLAEIVRMRATIAVAGTHGKTTTTTLVATLLESAGMDPTVINGGIINHRNTNAFLGKGEWLVVEADESDGTFIELPAHISIVTNMDAEHLDYYGSFTEVRKAFRTYIQRLPFYGLAVLCSDHPEVKQLAEEMMSSRRVYTYGLEGEPDFKAVNIRSNRQGSHFDVIISQRVTADDERHIKDIFLPTPGRHNVQNALAAVAVGFGLHLSEAQLKKAFEPFKGVKRRFTQTGEVKGITIIDDYGHHPTEIAATLATARSVVGKDRQVIAVFQPHRFSRVQNLLEDFANCFKDADIVVVTEIYSAGETPLPGITQQALIQAIQMQGKHVDVRELTHPEALAQLVHRVAKSGDIVVCLGAGNITSWAHALPTELATLAPSTESEILL